MALGMRARWAIIDCKNGEHWRKIKARNKELINGGFCRFIRRRRPNGGQAPHCMKLAGIWWQTGEAGDILPQTHLWRERNADAGAWMIFSEGRHFDREIIILCVPLGI